MSRLQYLFRSQQLSVTRFDHQPESVQRDPAEEVCRDYAIHFVEAGSFRLETQGGSWSLSPGAAFISRPGAVHRYNHEEHRPSDVCVSVRFSDRFFAEARGIDDQYPVDAPTAFAPANRLCFLRLRLTNLAASADGLALESLACELVSVVSCGIGESRLYSARQLRWYAERVEAVRETLEALYFEQHSLVSLARSVGMSPFQFARVFRELTGEPPHKYLLRVRLNHSARMLLGGKSVTETCFDVGFSNLSHFTRSFRRRFGCAPSSFKARVFSPSRI